MSTIKDAHELDWLSDELYEKRDHIGTAILLLAAAHYGHADTEDRLWKIDRQIVYDQLPLTEFKFLPEIVNYLKDRHSEYDLSDEIVSGNFK